MHIVFEQWSYKPAWKNLSRADREAFVGGVGGAVEHLATLGITTLGFGHNDSSTDKRASFDFWGIWQCPDARSAAIFQKAVTDSGWYDYFEHRNLSGELVPPTAILGAHIAA
jgi:hypothetical protein